MRRLEFSYSRFRWFLWQSSAKYRDILKYQLHFTSIRLIRDHRICKRMRNRGTAGSSATLVFGHFNYYFDCRLMGILQAKYMQVSGKKDELQLSYFLCCWPHALESLLSRTSTYQKISNCTRKLY